MHLTNIYLPFQVFSSRCRCQCRRIPPTLPSTQTLQTRTARSWRTAPSTPPNGTRNRCANFCRIAPLWFLRPPRRRLTAVAITGHRPPIIGSVCRLTKDRRGRYRRRRMMMTHHALNNNNRNDTLNKIIYGQWDTIIQFSSRPIFWFWIWMKSQIINSHNMSDKVVGESKGGSTVF